MKKEGVLRFLVEIAAVSFISVSLFVLSLHYFIKPFKVEGMSMEPLLRDGDRILVRRCFSPPEVKRGDVVVIEAPEGGYAVKRVAAVPGDEVSVADGELFVNDRSEGRIVLGDGDLIPLKGKVRIAEGYVYLLGDNRDKSLDSRAWGAVPVARIYGKPVMLGGAGFSGAPGRESSK